VSLFVRERRDFLFPPEPLPSRVSGNRGGVVPVTSDTAKQHSGVWACLRLRSDLVSTMPLYNTRQVAMDSGSIRVTIPSPPILTMPGGENCDITEWLAATQWDLDEVGNTFGIITQVNGYGLPQRIELQDRNSVRVVVKGGHLAGYRINGKWYDPAQVWHEKQFPQSGHPVGLSPLAHSAMAISEYLSAQQFTLQWFTDGGIPAAMLKNTAKTLKPEEAGQVKRTFKQSVANRDIFVTGADWEYSMIQADLSNVQFLESRRVSILDSARYFGVPADLIDAESTNKGAIKYQNITQKNLELLLINLQPALVRRERALGRALPSAQTPYFDADALLRMDPAVLAGVLQARINSHTLAPSEARATYYNLPPLTASQEDEFASLSPLPPVAGPGVELASVEPPA